LAQVVPVETGRATGRARAIFRSYARPTRGVDVVKAFVRETRRAREIMAVTAAGAIVVASSRGLLDAGRARIVVRFVGTTPVRNARMVRVVQDVPVVTLSAGRVVRSLGLNDAVEASVTAGRPLASPRNARGPLENVTAVTRSARLVARSIFAVHATRTAAEVARDASPRNARSSHAMVTGITFAAVRIRYATFELNAFRASVRVAQNAPVRLARVRDGIEAMSRVAFAARSVTGTQRLRDAVCASVA